MMDTNNDSEVDKEEFLQFVDPKLAAIWAASEFEQLDRDNSTTCSKDEFRMSSVHNMQVDPTVMSELGAFHMIDADGDGELSEQEYTSSATDLFSFIASDSQLAVAVRGVRDDTIARDSFINYSTRDDSSHI